MVASTSLAYRPGWVWLAAGVLGVIGGLFALLDPIAATLTAEQVAGWAFLVVGILQGIDTFRANGWWGRVWALLLAVIYILFALALLAQPLRGVLALTIVVALLLLLGGALKIGFAWRLRWSMTFWAVLASGVISILFGLIILANFPWSAAVVLGIFLGIDLVSSGLSLLIMWWAGRQHAAHA